MTRRAGLIALTLTIALAVLRPAWADTRLSGTTALVHAAPQAQAFLAAPGSAWVEGWVRFPADLDPNIWFGIDHEFIGGSTNPTRFPGEDFMALVALQRDGTVGIPIAGPGAHSGKADDAGYWEIRSLDRVLAPDVWHRIRVEADFGTLRFIGVTVDSPGGTRTQLDLSDLSLSYPQKIPADGRAMGFYTVTIRIEPIAPGRTTTVFFDDLSGGYADTVLYRDGFDRPAEIPDVPYSIFSGLKLARLPDGRAFRENSRALVRIQTGCGRTGGCLAANAK